MSRTKKVTPITKQLLAFVLVEINQKQLTSKFDGKVVDTWSLKLHCEKYIKVQKFIGEVMVDQREGELTYYMDVRLKPSFKVGEVFQLNHQLIRGEWLPDGFEVEERDFIIKDEDSGLPKTIRIKCLV